MPGPDRLDARVHRLVVDAVELLERVGRLADEARSHAVAVVALDDRAHVHHDRVALLERPVGRVERTLGDRPGRQERVEPVTLGAELVHAAHEGAVDLVLRHARGERVEAGLDALARDPGGLAHDLPLLLVLHDPLEEQRLLGVDELDLGHRGPERLEDHPGHAIDADLAAASPRGRRARPSPRPRSARGSGSR